MVKCDIYSKEIKLVSLKKRLKDKNIQDKERKQLEKVISELESELGLK